MSYRQGIENMNYYSDSRVRASRIQSSYEVLKFENGIAEVRLHECVVDDLQEDGHPITEILSVKGCLEDCYQCDGKGKVVNPAIDAGGISCDDFGEDPDFYESYMGGAYDIQCPECNGSGKMIGDIELPEVVMKACHRFDEDQHDSYNEWLSEMRYGC